MSETLRLAIRYVCRRRVLDEDATLSEIVREAAYHFDLTPIERDWLRRTFVILPWEEEEPASPA